MLCLHHHVSRIAGVVMPVAIRKPRLLTAKFAGGVSDRRTGVLAPCYAGGPHPCPISYLLGPDYYLLLLADTYYWLADK